MKNDLNQKTSSRRGFLSSFLKQLNIQNMGSSANINQEQVTQAGVLALKYAKNTENLTRIAVKKPTLLEENLYEVDVSGQNADGKSLTFKLQVDCLASHVEEITEDA